MDAPWRDADTLRRLYHSDNLTLSEVADELETTVKTIHKWMDKHGIERDSPGTSPNDDRVNDAEWLEQEYSVKQRSVAELADETGCSNKTILNRLEEHGIHTRPQRRLAGNEKVYDCEYLRREYIAAEKTALEIAEELGVGKTTVLRQMEVCGIDRRSVSEAASMASERVERTAFYTDPHGYEYAACKAGGRVRHVGIHRLVAIANGADPYTVFSGMDNHVHHKKNIPWLNTRENVEVVSADEHARKHME